MESDLPRQRLQRHCNIRCGVAHGGEQVSVGGEPRCRAAGVAGTTLEGKADRQVPAHQQFRLYLAIGVVQQSGRVVEAAAALD